MRENGIVSRIRTGRGGRVHELKSGKEEGEKKKVSSPFHSQDLLGNSSLLPRYISLKIWGESLVFFYEDILRLMKLSVLITYSWDNKLEPQGEVTYWSSLGYLFYFDITSGRRITLWYSEWRWNSEKLSYRISSNKRLYNFGQRRGRLLEGWL